jgi:hypothetical protein
MSYFDDHEDRLIYGIAPRIKLEARCRVCGSTDVRWRQQGGKWVLFSLQPGVEHQCSAEDLAKDFD